MNWKDGIWFNEERKNIIESILQPTGSYAIQEGKIRLKHSGFLAHQIPWAFSGQPRATACEFRNHIYWQKFRLIPAYCRLNCHKVVISMANVSDLIRCLTMQQQIYAVHGYSGKCGIDSRWYNPGLYKGFWYLQSLEEGRACHTAVVEAAKNAMKYAHTVILKKACTEMEHPFYGGRPSNEWEAPTQEEIELEAELEEIFGRSQTIQAQPAWLHNKIMFDWIRIANAAGDKSYTEFIEDITNYAPITYHEQGGDEEKRVIVLPQQAEEETTLNVGGN